MQANSNEFLTLSKKFSNPQPDIPLTEARAGLDAFLSDYLQQHKLITIENDKRRDDARKANKRTIRKVLPMAGAVVTVGVGKTESASKLAAAAAAAGIPVLILAPTSEMLRDDQSRIQKYGADSTVYKGRQYPIKFTKDEEKSLIDADNSPLARAVIQIKNAQPHDCYNKDAVTVAGNRGHRPGRGLCPTCPNGRAGAMMYGNLEAQAEAAHWFDKKALKSSDYAPCQYLYVGLPEQLKAKILLAPVGAFSAALTEWKETDKSDPVQRLVIVDESIESAAELLVTHSDVAEWVDRVDEIGRTAPEEQIDLWIIIRDALSGLNAALLNMTDIDEQSILSAAKAAATLESLSGGTARWERIRYVDEAYETPLRALTVLKTNIESGTFNRTFDLKKLMIYDLSPVYLHAKKRGSTIFLDATMPIQTKVLIDQAGGTLHQATARQNITVRRVKGVMYQRGKVTSNKYADEHANYFMRDALTVATSATADMAVIMHKSIIDKAPQLTGTTTDERIADFERKTGQRIGYFGRHDRGFDGFKGRNLAIFGQIILGPEAVRSLYNKSRALLQMSGISMPTLAAATDDNDDAFLPVDPVPRALVLDYYAQSVAQAIGRARGVNAEQTLTIDLYGGYDTDEMNNALLIHGVTIDDEKVNTMRGAGRQEHLIMTAIEALEVNEKRVSRRSIEEQIRSNGGTIRKGVIDTLLREMRAAGRLAGASRNQYEYAVNEQAPDTQAPDTQAIEAIETENEVAPNPNTTSYIGNGASRFIEEINEFYEEIYYTGYTQNVWEDNASEMTASEIENSQ